MPAQHAGSRLTVYRGPAGDHNDRGHGAVTSLGEALAQAVGVPAVEVGAPVAADPVSWDGELRRCRSALRDMADRIEHVLSAGVVPVTAMTRCAVALATLPRVISHHPDAVVLWLDAHGDIHTPGTTSTGYLGGMALSGPLGWWDSGLGAGLPESQAALVGTRDLDPAEAEHVRAGRITVVPPGSGWAERLAEWIAGRPSYWHIDCDVLEPGILATDYSVPGGLTLQDLHAGAVQAAASAGGVVGVEIAEYEGPDTAGAADLVAALAPLLGSARPVTGPVLS